LDRSKFEDERAAMSEQGTREYGSYGLLIGGEWREAADGARAEVRSPYDGRAVGEVAASTPPSPRLSGEPPCGAALPLTSAPRS
jgi:hypothetical protein